MHQDDIKALFDQQAASYDTQWAKTAPIRDGLHFLLDSMFAGLPDDARVLIAGVVLSGRVDSRLVFKARLNQNRSTR